MFCLTERPNFVQNPRLTSYGALLNFLLLSWVFDFFSIFHKEVFFPRVSATSFSFHFFFLLFDHCICLVQFVFVYVLLSLTENKGRTLEITRDFYFFPLCFCFSVFLLLVCPCTCHRFLISFAFSFAIFQSLPALKGCEQRKYSSMEPSLGVIW